MTYSSREIDSIDIKGTEVRFITSNERLADRVRNASNEEYILDKLVEISDDGECLWDVGACLGIHTYVGSSFYDNVVAFEPMPTNRGAMVDNMHVNRCENVYICREALADESGTEEFAIRGSQEAGHSRHSFDHDGYDKVRTMTVETARGDDIDRCRHVILETHEPNPVQPSYEDYGYTEEDLWHMLEDAGFTVERMVNDYHLYGRKS